MMPGIPEIIDGDGHLFERDEDIRPYLPSRYAQNGSGSSYFFPTLDGWRRGSFRAGYSDAEGWLKFMEGLEIGRAVLYPTATLAFGFCRDKKWAADISIAYNDFVADAFLKATPRLKAVALLPLQDPEAAAQELQRAVEKLGMVGGLLPSTGLLRPYGDTAYDPVYATAEALGVPLAVHGAARQGLGFDFLEDGNQGFVLSHPMGLMIQFTNMIYERVFERFPRLKVAYLEAGAGWAPYLIERIDRRTERTGRHLASEQVRDHPIYFQAELDEKQVLTAALDEIGDDHFIYASDYPHEQIPSITEGAARVLGSRGCRARRQAEDPLRQHQGDVCTQLARGSLDASSVRRWFRGCSAEYDPNKLLFVGLNISQYRARNREGEDEQDSGATFGLGAGRQPGWMQCSADAADHFLGSSIESAAADHGCRRPV